MKVKYTEALLLLFPFLCWVLCFRDFFSGHIFLQQDAISYANHIGFYTDNLSKGVYPLWNPDWFNGAPYHFFLRRMGDVNPLLFFIVFLKWAGVPSASAYLCFLAMYYFLAGWAFYLIARSLFVDRFYAFGAYLLFLFSSWGNEIFYNYIVIIFVPIIWFFYFLLSFYRDPKKGYFLGMCLCAGLIITTYIPFFFLTILSIFTVLFLLFYRKLSIDLFQRTFNFFIKNKVFTSFCIVFLLLSCVPGYIFYKESKSGQYVLPDRHAGSDAALPIAVSLSSVASGDFVNHGFIDHLFNDHKILDMGDIYIPFIFFLLLLTATMARVNKLILFLLFNIMALSLIAISSASGVYRFLFEHIPFFKLMRNVYYFFWLAIFPMGILLTVTAWQALMISIKDSKRKNLWLFYVGLCHLAFILFLLRQDGTLFGAWAAVIFSLAFFVVFCIFEERISTPFGFCAIFLAVVIQSSQVYGFLERRIYQIQEDSTNFVTTHPNNKILRMDLYYTSPWLALLNDFIDPAVLQNYMPHKYIFYDNVVPYNDSPGSLKTFELSAASHTNIAYVSKFESEPGDWRANTFVNPQANYDPLASGEILSISNDANTFKFKTHLSFSRFLVINDNYNSAWHAFINGHPARLLRANVAFKGLWIPAGENQVLLRYADNRSYIIHIGLIFIYLGVFIYLLVLLKTYV